MPRPIAVIQLALPMGPTAMRCYLLHIACSGITPSLSRILCSPVSVSKLNPSPSYWCVHTGLLCHVCLQEGVPSLAGHEHRLDKHLRSSPCSVSSMLPP